MFHFRVNVIVVTPPDCVIVAPLSRPEDVTVLGVEYPVLLRCDTPLPGTPTIGRHGAIEEHPKPMPTLRSRGGVRASQRPARHCARTHAHHAFLCSVSVPYT